MVMKHGLSRWVKINLRMLRNLEIQIPVLLRYSGRE